MVTGLLDTAIIVDLLRGYRPARQWFDTKLNLAIPAFVWIEILQGAANKIALQRAAQLLKQFERVNVTDTDIEWSIQQLTRYHLSHNVGGVDCLIAAPAHRLSIPLYTANLKHFTPLVGKLAQKPY
jgi:predicted nucleic acid-binding protein